MVNRVGRVLLRRYTFEFTRDLAPVRTEITMVRPTDPSGAPVARLVASFQGDSAFSEVTRDTAVVRRRVGFTPGAAVAQAGPYAMWELMAQRALRGRADSVAYLAYGAGNPSPTPMSAWRLGRDSIAFSTPWDVYHARVERDGRILGSRPLYGTTQFAIERVSDVDVRAIGARWASTEQPAQNALSMSPRDTVRATIGGAQLLVDYGRPSKRGRTVFPDVVRYDSIWRTGANAATQFRTDRALEMGGVVIPAGTYTLWTLPSASGWKLIINSETGQWGTDHHADRDLFQLPMTMGRPASPVETFTISLAPSGSSGGVMRLEWDGTRAEMPFTVR